MARATSHPHFRFVSFEELSKKKRNMQPCGHCQEFQVKCETQPPYSSKLCRKCAIEGLDECPPHKKRAKKGKSRESPSTEEGQHSRQPSPSGSPSIPAHDNERHIKREGSSSTSPKTFTSEDFGVHASGSYYDATPLLPVDPSHFQFPEFVYPEDYWSYGGDSNFTLPPESYGASGQLVEPVYDLSSGNGMCYDYWQQHQQPLPHHQ